MDYGEAFVTLRGRFTVCYCARAEHVIEGGKLGREEASVTFEQTSLSLDIVCYCHDDVTVRDPHLPVLDVNIGLLLRRLFAFFPSPLRR